MSGTQEAAVVAARRLADTCSAILDPTLVAAILHGSLTMDDFRPGTSDLDVLLVVEQRLRPRHAHALVDAVRTADVGPAGGIDLLVVSRQAAERSADHPCRELLVGRWPGPGQDLEVEQRDEHVADLWPELSMARAMGRSLIGPDPHEVIGEVPAGLVRTNGAGWLNTWLERTDDEANAVLMVLTACRIWRFATEGVHSSKSAAARWALAQDPSLTAVEQALREREGAASAPITPDEVERVLLRVLRDTSSPR